MNREINETYRRIGFPDKVAGPADITLMVARKLLINEKLDNPLGVTATNEAAAVAFHHAQPQKGATGENVFGEMMQNEVCRLSSAEAALFSAHIEWMQNEDRQNPMKGSGASATYFSRAISQTQQDSKLITKALGTVQRAI